jgi:hypothetical protein
MIKKYRLIYEGGFKGKDLYLKESITLLVGLRVEVCMWVKCRVSPSLSPTCLRRATYH